jgi:hypothetical protein
MALKLPKLDKTMGMVEFRMRDPRSGQWVTVQGVPTPDFQRWWQSATVKADATGSDIDDKVDVVTINYTAPTISNPPTQAQVQAIANALEAVTEALRNE